LSADLQVLEAENGLKAVEAVEKNRIDVVVLDSTMPVMDGATTLRVLRARGHTMPVILLTGDAKATRVASLLALGAQEFVAKPLQEDELRRKVFELLKPKSAADLPTSTRPGPTTFNAPPKPVSAKRIPVLLVDSNEAAVGRFWEAIPPFVDLQFRPDVPAAIEVLKQQVFRAVVIDATLLKMAPAEQLVEVKAARRQAALVGVYLRTIADPNAAALGQGLDAGVHKPFDADQIHDLMEKLAGLLVTLEVQGNILTLRPFPHTEEQQRAFGARLAAEVMAAIDGAAEASETALWLHISQPLPLPLLTTLAETALTRCRLLGLTLGWVDPNGHGNSLRERLRVEGARLAATLDDIS